MDNKYFLKPLKFKEDENNSFQYFRSFITFYYCALFSKDKSIESIKKYYKLAYNGTQYFNLFQSFFLDNQNPLIFTYFNPIPTIFYPYFKDLYYYYPIISFYGNEGFYKNGFLKFSNKIPGTYQENIKIPKDEIQITIPIYLIKGYELPLKYYLLIKTKDKIFSSNQVEISNNGILMKNYKIKYKKYKDSNEDLFIKLDEIVFVSVLKPITKEGLVQSFKMDKIKKDALLYYIVSEKSYSKRIQLFYTLYPKINMFNLDTTYDLQYRCVRNRLLKDLNLINLTVDIFYNNEIVNKEVDTNFLDYSDEKYEKIMKDDIFRCLHYDNVMDERRDICNYNIMLPYGKDTFIKNKGKKMLNLLVFKNHFFNDYNVFYCSDLLFHFGIPAFLNHYGYLLKDNKRLYYDMEIGFYNKKFVKEYIKKVNEVMGDCPDLYKKGRLDF